MLNLKGQMIIVEAIFFKTASNFRIDSELIGRYLRLLLVTFTIALSTPILCGASGGMTVDFI